MTSTTTTTTTLRFTRICPGCYEVTIQGRVFELRSMRHHTEGESAERRWISLDTVVYDGYMGDYRTLAEAKKSLSEWAAFGPGVAAYIADNPAD